MMLTFVSSLTQIAGTIHDMLQATEKITGLRYQLKHAQARQDAIMAKMSDNSRPEIPQAEWRAMLQEQTTIGKEVETIEREISQTSLAIQNFRVKANTIITLLVLSANSAPDIGTLLGPQVPMGSDAEVGNWITERVGLVNEYVFFLVY